VHIDYKVMHEVGLMSYII